MKYKFLKIVVLFVVVVSVLLVTFSKDNNLELYAIKYGDSLYHSKHIYNEDSFNKLLPFIWTFYVIKYDGKIILVDTGFREKSLIKQYNIDHKDPLVSLKKLGVKPSLVTDVIITHSHFDHIGNVDKFINAKIYIQKDELNKFKETSKNKEIVDFLKNNKNIVTFDEVYKLYEIFKIEKIGGHTIGSSIVFFSYKNKDYVLTGDECYFIENCQGKPIGSYYDIEKNRSFIERIDQEDNKVILPFHDPKIFDKYKKLDSLVVKII